MFAMTMSICEPRGCKWCEFRRGHVNIRNVMLTSNLHFVFVLDDLVKCILQLQKKRIKNEKLKLK